MKRLLLLLTLLTFGLLSGLDAAPRSSQWPEVRAVHLQSHPTCAACGCNKDLEVHHVQPFHEHPELELDPGNLITLCNKHGCHLAFGHLWDFHLDNPHVREDAARMLKRRMEAVAKHKAESSGERDE